MVRKWLFLSLFVLIMSTPTFSSFAENSEKKIQSKVCPKGDCRGETKVFLKVKDGPAYEKVFPYLPPVVQNMMVTVYPGEKVYVEAEIKNDKLVSFTSVNKVKRPESTVSFVFYQNPKMGDGTAMFLTVHNPFLRVLKYDLKMMTLDGNISKTSCCPVLAGKDSYEHWPHPIFQLIFENFHFVDENSEDAKNCE